MELYEPEVGHYLRVHYSDTNSPEYKYSIYTLCKSPTGRFHITWVKKLRITRRGIHIRVTCPNVGPIGPLYVQ